MRAVLKEESMRPGVGREVTSLVTGNQVTGLQGPHESSSELVGPEWGCNTREMQAQTFGGEVKARGLGLGLSS